MYQLHLIQAAYGDCLLLSHGDPDAPRHILIDGGPRGTYRRHLRSFLAPLGAAGHALDLVLLSHVDTDHISGLLDYFAELRDQQGAGSPPLPAAHALWHNSFGHTVDPAGTLAPRFASLLNHAGVANAQTLMSHSNAALLGIAQGNTLRVLAQQLAIPVNEGFPGDLISTATAPDPLDLHGLTLRVVGPTPDNLAALRREWETWLDRNQDIITDAGPLVLANVDESVPNLSSICVLATAEGRTLLLTGDARGDHIIQGLTTAGLLEPGGTFHVDVLKLPHHGSDRNLDPHFFATVTADRYVVSADGTHGNPDPPTYTWLVEAAHAAGRPVEIIATNATPSSRTLLESHPPDEWGYTLTLMPDHYHYLTLDLT